MATLELNEVAALAAEYVNTTNRHIFLTGKAGTGKTTFLRYITRHTFKNTVVAAPTGIAAINAGGVTLHSLLQLPFGAFVPENIPLPDSFQTRINTPSSLRKYSRMRREKVLLLQQLELLIIDEVSMLRADLLDCIDFRLRSIRRRPREAFGGVQLLLIGDLMQLPPVVKDHEWQYLHPYYESPFFFAARALKMAPPLTVELQKIYRQQDDRFIGLLNRLRNNQQSADDLDFLNQFYLEDLNELPDSGYIHLTTHNYKADHINQERLDELREKERVFKAEIEGDFPQNLYPLPSDLRLKKGAQVMFIKNDPTGEGRFFNGKLGQVHTLNSYEISVAFEEGEVVKVEPYEWQNIQYTVNPHTNQVEEEVLGTFLQFPLKLAWAVTVHKSQGLTFEKAILDVGDSFAPGQLYVALSRLTSLMGLALSSPLPTRPPKISPTLIAFVEAFEDPAQLQDRIHTDRKGFIQQFASRAYSFDELEKMLKIHIGGFNKDENRSLKQQYLSWTQELFDTFQPLCGIGKTFIQQVYGILAQADQLEQLALRCTKAQHYFEPILMQLLRKVQVQIQELGGKKQVKAYKKELEDLEAAFMHQLRQIAKFTLFAQELSNGKVPSLEMLKGWELEKKLQRPPVVKKPKVPTAEITLGMFQEGLSVEAIAEKRELTVGTIQNHLCKYVAKGQLSPEQVMDPEKIPVIQRAIQQASDKHAGTLKRMLDESISYEDIRFVLAYEKAKEG